MLKNAGATAPSKARTPTERGSESSNGSSVGVGVFVALLLTPVSVSAFPSLPLEQPARVAATAPVPVALRNERRRTGFASVGLRSLPRRPRPLDSDVTYLRVVTVRYKFTETRSEPDSGWGLCGAATAPSSHRRRPASRRSRSPRGRWRGRLPAPQPPRGRRSGPAASARGWTA